MDQDQEVKPDVKTSRIETRMLDKKACEIQARQFVSISDEKPWNGGQDRGPSPLEYVLTGLGA